MNQNLNNASTSMTKPIKNAKFLGLDVNFPVFLISAGLAILFSCLVLIFPENSTTFLSSSRQFVVSRFDTLFTVSMLSFTFVIFFLIVSPFGRIKLGGKDSSPEFSFLSWICMLFAAGVGIGMTFYGAAEPLSYYTGVFGTP